MAFDFLTAEQKAQYGQFSDDPNEIQLAKYFHLDEADLTFIFNRRGDLSISVEKLPPVRIQKFPHGLVGCYVFNPDFRCLNR